MTTAQLMRLRHPDARDVSVVLRAGFRLAVRRARFGAFRCACRDFGVWMRSGATLGQAARVAAATFRAFV